MKKILLTIISLFIFTSSVYATTGDVLEDENTTPTSCAISDFELFGSSKVKVGTPQEYVIKSNYDYKDFEKLEYRLSRDGDLIDTVTQEKYLGSFSQPGVVNLTAQFKMLNGCEYVLEKNIKIYKTQYAYIGSDLSYLNSDIDNIFENKDILFKKIILGSDSTILKVNDNFSAILYNNLLNIKESDIIIIKNNDPNSVFSILENISKNKETGIFFDKKRIYVVSDMGTNLATKLLTQHIKEMGAAEVYLLENNLLLNLLIKLGDIETSSKETEYDLISSKKQGGIYSLNTLVFAMVHGGFPASVLGFILSIAIAILFINFSKQIIGIFTFGMYNPLFLAISLSMISFKLVLILFFLASISTYIVNLFVKKVHLLFNAKRAFLMTLYLIFTIIFFGIDNYYSLGFVDNSIFSNIFLIFPFLFIVLIADKIFHEDIKLFSKTGSILFFEFIFLSGVSFHIINDIKIQYFLLSYPDILFLIVLLNIVIGRFTGLQLFEYIRFIPLLRNTDSEEEE